MLNTLISYGVRCAPIFALSAVGGIGVAVEKGFQDGGDSLRREGYPIKSLAIIDSVEDGVIRFREDD